MTKRLDHHQKELIKELHKNISSYKVVWQPQAGRQEALVTCPFPVIGYGGARGGGKTDGALGKLGIKACMYKINAIFFRQEMVQADDLIARAVEIYEPLKAKYNKKHTMFIFPNGSRLRFRQLKTLEDAKKYQGQGFTDAVVEEAGNYPSPAPIFLIFGALRSAKGVPVQLVLTFNPAGAGNQWLKELFVEPNPKGMVPLDLKINQSIEKGVFIPAKVQDNKKLLENDPEYVNRLKLTGSPEVVRAWLEGDFNINLGNFFSLGSDIFIDRFEIPDHWDRYIGQDWGFADPFACVWMAISTGFNDDGTPHEILKSGQRIIYRAIKQKQVNNVDQAKIIANLSSEERITAAVLDPSCWNSTGYKSIANQMNSFLQSINLPYIYKPANNDRLGGWSYLRDSFNNRELFIFNDLEDYIKDMVSLPTDRKKAEDVDTKSNDHFGDATRYVNMAYFYNLVAPSLDRKDKVPTRGVWLQNALKKLREKNGTKRK